MSAGHHRNKNHSNSRKKRKEKKGKIRKNLEWLRIFKTIISKILIYWSKIISQFFVILEDLLNISMTK